jgi:hypothetical protein
VPSTVMVMGANSTVSRGYELLMSWCLPIVGRPGCRFWCGR